MKNNITALPNEIGKLVNLKKIYLVESGLSKLPPAIVKLKNLDVLNLNWNYDLKLTPEQNIWINNLKENNCSVSPSFYGEEIEDWVKRLWKWADENNISEGRCSFRNDDPWGDCGTTCYGGIPREMGHIYYLISLDISDNYNIIELPIEIAHLSILRSISIENTSLAKIPKEIGQLSFLRSLHLSNNKLTELPKEIGSLTDLRSLYLYSNKLTELPKEIVNLSNLESLYIKGNPNLVLTSEQQVWIKLMREDIKNDGGHCTDFGCIDSEENLNEYEL